MNLLKGITFLLLRILSVNTADITSGGKYATSERSKHYTQQHVRRDSERRFLDDLDDKDWHVSHLKDSDFHFKTDCKEETFADKINKYRKTLKEDGSLVDYVFADALPNNDSALVKNKCVTLNTTIKDSAKFKKGKVKNGNYKNSKEKIIITGMNAETTAGLIESLNSSQVKVKLQNSTVEKSRRASEYQFSSEEYYDEVDEFQDQFCPEFVEVIHLEIDILRNYDLECELTLEWRSLD